jgi:hypothetical protein
MSKDHARGPRRQRYHRDPVASASAENPPAHERSAVWLRRVDALVANPFFAYSGIVVLQLRVIWKVWSYRDLTFGDTAGYFRVATTWAHSAREDVVWAPLYTTSVGTMLAVIRNVPATVMGHRVLIVLGVTVLVLALMRSLLGPPIGLIVAVWWSVIPTNFNVEYELHLFSLIPILVAALVVATRPSRTRIGVAFAILLACALLLRNELVIASAIFAVAIGVYESRSRDAHRGTYLRAYGIPILAVSLLFAGAYWRSTDKGHVALENLRNNKHELNFCQAYAFNLQQRRPREFTGNPFTQCQPLMQRTFGRALPSAFYAMKRNPRAVTDFVAWNTALVPAGMQVSLFGATSTGMTPGYFPVKQHRWYALVLSLLGLGLLGGAVATAVRRRDWWHAHAWAALVLGATSLTALFVALTQRPRPEYIFTLTLVLMAAAVVGFAALLSRLGWAYLTGVLALLTLLLAFVAMRPYYHPSPRPIHDGYERLQPVRKELQTNGSILVTSTWGFELCAYLSYTVRDSCLSPSWADFRKRITGADLIRPALRRAHVTVLYADSPIQADPVFRRFLHAPRAFGWREVDRGVGADGPWSVLVRR